VVGAGGDPHGASWFGAFCLLLRACGAKYGVLGWPRYSAHQQWWQVNLDPHEHRGDKELSIRPN
jgi:hypothetical protein